MRDWTIAEWYPVLVESKSLVFVHDWTLHQRSDTRVELIHQSGVMCKAEVEEDGVGRVRGEESIFPLPEEVIEKLQELLNLSSKKEQ